MLLVSYKRMGQALLCAFISELEDAYQIDSERLPSP